MFFGLALFFLGIVAQPVFEHFLGQAPDLVWRSLMVACFLVGSLAVLTSDPMYKALFRTEGVREIVYVVPQRNDGGALPLVVWNRGTTPLSSVTIIIRRHGDQGETQEELGPLPPNVPKWLDTTIAPVPANDGTDTYHFMIYTPALAFTQTIKFRRWTPPDPRLPEWAHCYWIKQGLLAEDSLEEAEAARLAERGWWDEGHFDPLFKKS